jgi:hypothetical protein
MQNKINRLGAVAQVCNFSYSGGRYQEGRVFTGQLGLKVRHPSQSMAGYSGAVVIPATQGSKDRRIMVQASPGIKQGPISKITKEKWASS